VRFAAHGVHRLRNVTDPVKVFASLPTTGVQSELVIDPVCRMAVDPHGAAGTLAHDGRTYYFCSLECAARFAASPETYEKTEPL
jgi:YHS domain-containing protein